MLVPMFLILRNVKYKLFKTALQMRTEPCTGAVLRKKVLGPSLEVFET